jgi:hypothetical protein
MQSRGKSRSGDKESFKIKQYKSSMPTIPLRESSVKMKLSNISGNPYTPLKTNKNIKIRN